MNLSPEIQTFIISILPIAGIRVSIPYGIVIAGLSWQLAFSISIVGGLFSMLMIFFFLESVTNLLTSYSETFEKIINYVFKKTKRDKRKQVDKYGYLALAGFTAVPLPFSGVWTSSLVTYLFGLSYKKAFISIAIGAIISAGVVTAITETGESLESVGGLKLVGLFFLVIIFYYYAFVNTGKNKKIKK